MFKIQSWQAGDCTLTFNGDRLPYSTHFGGHTPLPTVTLFVDGDLREAAEHAARQIDHLEVRFDRHGRLALSTTCRMTDGTDVLGLITQFVQRLRSSQVHRPVAA